MAFYRSRGPARTAVMVGGFLAVCAVQGAAVPEPEPRPVPGRVHHLNGATMRPFGKWAVEGTGGLFEAGRMVAHLLLVETTAGLVLVDSGLGTRDVNAPDDRLPARWQLLARPALNLHETAVRQVERLGFRAAHVTDIVLSHLDLDHAGGISDFPAARIHVSAAEHATALGSKATRYKPAMWSHSPKWAPHDLGGERQPGERQRGERQSGERQPGERWFGLPSVRILPGVEPEIRLVALPGHSAGHGGVAVKSGQGWLLHAGDAYFSRGEIHQPRRTCPVGLEFFQASLQVDAKVRLGTQDALRHLAQDRAGEVQIFSAHDPVELDAFN